jgi:hypothetical protein
VTETWGASRAPKRHRAHVRTESPIRGRADEFFPMRCRVAVRLGQRRFGEHLDVVAVGIREAEASSPTAAIHLVWIPVVGIGVVRHPCRQALRDARPTLGAAGGGDHALVDTDHLRRVVRVCGPVTAAICRHVGADPLSPKDSNLLAAVSRSGPHQYVTAD